MIRFIEERDLHEGYFQLLSELSGKPINAKDLYGQWPDFINKLWRGYKNSPNRSTFVFEKGKSRPKETSFIIGTATLLVEHKFLHGGGIVGHIEDVVVDPNQQGESIGSELVKRCVDKAKNEGCYKVILDCSEDNITFYEKCGFHKSEMSMRVDLI